MNGGIDNSVLHKELDHIQEVIKRMASNSFLIKGWAITLVVATLIVKGTETHLIISFLPTIAFWYLDAYYLRQERLYRQLYSWVVENRSTTAEHLYSLDTSRFSFYVDSVGRIMLSVSLGVFYGSIFVLVSVFFILLKYKLIGG